MLLLPIGPPRAGSTALPGPAGMTVRRGKLPRVFLCALVLCGVLASAVVESGCGEGTTSQPRTVSEAFKVAHPDNDVPPGLIPQHYDERSVLKDVAAAQSAALEVWLPQDLRADYGLAPPYVAVGSGAALPNPQVWDGGYRVSFTNGDTLLVVAAGLDRVPGQGEWQETGQVLAGAPLLRRGGEGVVLRRPGDPDLVVSGLGVSQEDLLRFALSLRALP